MRLTRALNKLICRVLIGVVLFAQFAVASYACPSGMAMGAGAMDAADAVTSSSPSDLDYQTPNLCAEHCKIGHQSSDTAPAPVVALPMLDLLYALPQRDDVGAVALSAAVPDPLLAVPPPPHAILHCVFRT
ncbi:hypothetical protein [Roseateles puraquae]|uniref:Copper resistance protein n=1 Tax=Roseateles puraquae TaxID=431059 RepID=A0A254N933_9BURK|nr:hypothetical protein [Roseateles puraquae]MDG0854453.1 hypothetical protein [Roseateles puraquae]OWR00851.1 hypothetical protein CDO81_24280 [Roseateles puraquae]